MYTYYFTGSPSTGSVGKLKLSSEMKERLEAVTGGSSRKNSIKSNASKKSDASMEAQGGDPTGKLAETKKMLIEQKLGTGNEELLYLLDDLLIKFYPFFVLKIAQSHSLLFILFLFCTPLL